MTKKGKKEKLFHGQLVSKQIQKGYVLDNCLYLKCETDKKSSMIYDVDCIQWRTTILYESS